MAGRPKRHQRRLAAFDARKAAAKKNVGAAVARTDDWPEKFLAALARTHMVTEACKIAGVSRPTVYRRRARDQAFAQRWEDEMERSTEVLEQVAIKRALEGSDNLMIFLLKARRPTVYRENVHHDHQVSGQVSVLHEGLQPVSVEASKRREAARLLLEAHEAEVSAQSQAPEDEVTDGEFVDIDEGEEFDEDAEDLAS